MPYKKMNFKRHDNILYIIAIVFGVVLNLSNPFALQTNPISFSDIVFSQSLFFRNSSIEFLSFGDILTLLKHMFPVFVFQAIEGISTYRFYCISGAYVFSRITNREKWYLKQMFELFLKTTAFEGIYLLSSTCTIVLSVSHYLDECFWVVLSFHYIGWVLWLFIFVMIINTLSIYVGSSNAFFGALIIQILLIGALLSISQAGYGMETKSLLARINPFTCLIPELHSSRLFLELDYSRHILNGVYMEDSLILLSILCATMLVVSKYVICRLDIMSCNAEYGGL